MNDETSSSTKEVLLRQTRREVASGKKLRKLGRFHGRHLGGEIVDIAVATKAEDTDSQKAHD